jgi:thioredoxin 1
MNTKLLMTLTTMVTMVVSSCQRNTYQGSFPSYSGNKSAPNSTIKRADKPPTPSTDTRKTGAKVVNFYNGTFENALAEAQRTGKGLMLDFTAKWCGPCQLMGKETFRNSSVADVAQKLYIPVKVDIEQFSGMDIADRFKVSQYPTIVFLDSKGKYVNRIKGFYPSSNLIVEMKKNSRMKNANYLSSL